MMTDQERIAELETERDALASELDTMRETLRATEQDLERARAELEIATEAAASNHLVATERATAIEEALAAEDGAPTNAILEVALAGRP